MKLKRLASKTLATATAFSMATTLFAGVPAVPVSAASKSSNFKIEAEYGKFNGVEYGPGDFSNNCSIREFAGSVTIDGITLDEAGSRKVTLYYASGEDRPVEVKVNDGATKEIPCNSTGTWVSGARSVSFTADFIKGENTIKISSAVGPNLDYITVEMTPEEEQKTLLGMINSLKSSSALNNADTVKASALEVAFDSMSDKSDVYIKNSLSDVIRAINKNATFTYEAELGTTDGEIKNNRGSNGQTVGLYEGWYPNGEHKEVSIKVWKEEAEETQVAVYYVTSSDFRCISCTANGTETVFEPCTALRKDLAVDGNDDLQWQVPNPQPVSKKIPLKAGENTLTFRYPNNTAGIENIAAGKNDIAPDIDKFQIALNATEEAETIKLMAKNGASGGGLENAFLSLSTEAKESLAKETDLSLSLKSLVSDWSNNKEDKFGEEVAKYKVTFDANGGTFADEKDKEKEVEEGKLVEAPEVDREGYDLVGWYNGDKKFDFEKDTITKEVTLKAEWALNVDGVEQKFNDVKDNMPKIEDKIYYPEDKWDAVENKEKEIQTLIDDARENPDVYTPTAEVEAATVEKILQKIEKEYEPWMMELVASRAEEYALCEVTFDPDNGEDVTACEVIKGELVPDVYIPTPEKDGYNFDGWGCKPKWSEKVDLSKVAIDGDTDFKAIWSINLDYYLNKYEDKLAEIESKYNEEDYTEDTWATVKDILEKLSAEKDLGDAANAETINNLLAQLEEALSKLEVKSFEVTFDSNGGSKVDSQTVKKGETAEEPDEPTKNNYDFKGWFLGNDLYDFDTPVTGPITLTAQWNKNATVVDLENKVNSLIDQFNKLESGKYDQTSYSSVQEIIKQIQEELAKPNPDYNKIQTLMDQLNIALNGGGLKEIPQVVETKVTGIALTADPSTKIAAGKKVQLDAEVTPANATNKTLVWESSNPSYATVDATGLVTTKKAGKGKTVVITAKAADGSGIQKTVSIKIMKKAVKKIKLTASTKTLKVGKKLTVKATVTPKAKASQINAKLQWVSSNPKYATVNKKGVVKALKKGKGKTVKITATSTDGTKKKATFQIKIK